MNSKIMAQAEINAHYQFQGTDANTLLSLQKESLESKSHATTNSRPEHHYMVVNESILDYAEQANATIIIHGHTHRPGYYSLMSKNATLIHRYEIPDWQDHAPGGYIELNNNQISIIASSNKA